MQKIFARLLFYIFYSPKPPNQVRIEIGRFFFSLLLWECVRDKAALVRSHMNGLKPFERTTEQTTETMPPSPKTVTAAAMTTN